MLDLYWQSILIRLNIRKQCLCKPEWQAVQTTNPLRTVCIGCFKCRGGK